MASIGEIKTLAAGFATRLKTTGESSTIPEAIQKDLDDVEMDLFENFLKTLGIERVTGILWKEKGK